MLQSKNDKFMLNAAIFSALNLLILKNSIEY